MKTNDTNRHNPENTVRALKQYILALSHYRVWLLLLLLMDLFSSLLLWLADVRAFWTLISVILLASLLFFSAACLILLRRTNRQIHAFLSYLDNPDICHEELLQKEAGALYTPALHALSQTLHDTNAASAGYQTALSNYEDYVESWAHEIKVPLSLLTLLIDNHREELPETVGFRLDYVRSQMQEHINQMLFYARSNGMRKDYLFEDTDVRSSIEDVLEDYLPLLEEKKFQIHIHVSGENVYTDRRGFCFLLSQFVSNAIKYSKDSPELSFHFQKTDQSDVLIIRDNGTGVPSCDLPFIFEKGFTGDSGKNRKKATGMGLFLAKEIARDLNISLNAYSEYGKGFEMQMEFPVFHCF